MRSKRKTTSKLRKTLINDVSDTISAQVELKSFLEASNDNNFEITLISILISDAAGL